MNSNKHPNDRRHVLNVIERLEAQSTGGEWVTLDNNEAIPVLNVLKGISMPAYSERRIVTENTVSDHRDEWERGPCASRGDDE